MKRTLFMIFSVSLSGYAMAQSDSISPPMDIEAVEVVEVEKKEGLGLSLGGVEISGYVDAYYQSTFENTSLDVQDRYFYTQQESFALGNVNLTFTKEIGKFGGLGQIGFGPRARAANGDQNPAIQQLYVFFKPSDKIKLTLGKFGTFIGYEVIDAPTNFHYSTSNLFQNGPFFHTGLKADFDLGSNFSLMAGVFNDTDTDLDPNGNFLHYGLQLGYSTDQYNVYLNGLYGTPNLKLNNQNKEFQIDLVADATLDKAYFAINGSYYNYNPKADGLESSSWWGIAGYGQYQLSDPFAIGARIEYFDDMDGFIGKWGSGTDGSGDGNVIAVTFSTPYSVDGFKIIPEIRLDLADNKVFQASTSKTQFSLGAAVMYSF